MAHNQYASGRVLGQTVRQETIVGATDTIELFQTTGQAVFANGEVWTVAQMEIDTIRNGSGSMEGQNIFVHPDGSTIVGTYKGKVKLEPKSNRMKFSGTWEHVSGTGRAKNIKASGKFSGSGSADKYEAEITGEAS